MNYEITFLPLAMSLEQVLSGDREILEFLYPDTEAFGTDILDIQLFASLCNDPSRTGVPGCHYFELADEYLVVVGTVKSLLDGEWDEAFECLLPYFRVGVYPVNWSSAVLLSPQHVYDMNLNSAVLGERGEIPVIPVGVSAVLVDIGGSADAVPGLKCMVDILALALAHGLGVRSNDAIGRLVLTGVLSNDKEEAIINELEAIKERYESKPKSKSTSSKP